MASQCDNCWYNTYDEEMDDYYCDLQLDEDEYVKLLRELGNNKSCRYFRPDIGEYGIVRKQN